MSAEHHQRRELIPAEACFRRALVTAPEDSNALRLLGKVLIDLGRYDEAIFLIRNLVAQHPDSATAFYTLGNAYRLSGRIGEAITAYQAALALSLGEEEMVMCGMSMGHIDPTAAANRLRTDREAVETFAEFLSI